MIVWINIYFWKCFVICLTYRLNDSCLMIERLKVLLECLYPVYIVVCVEGLSIRKKMKVLFTQMWLKNRTYTQRNVHIFTWRSHELTGNLSLTLFNIQSIYGQIMKVARAYNIICGCFYHGYWDTVPVISMKTIVNPH